MKSMRTAVLERDIAETSERQRIQYVNVPGLIVIAPRRIDSQPTVKEIYAGLTQAHSSLIGAPPVRARDFKHYGVPGDSLPF